MFVKLFTSGDISLGNTLSNFLNKISPQVMLLLFTHNNTTTDFFHDYMLSNTRVPVWNPVRTSFKIKHCSFF